MRRILTVLMTMGLLAALAIPVIAQGGAIEGDHDDLQELKAATARFHSRTAVERGRLPARIHRTLSAQYLHRPPHPGSHGVPLVQPRQDPRHEIDPLSPEAMVYAPDDDGELKLAAVEWVVPKGLWEAEHGVGAAPPTVTDTKCTS